jgi:hypothetical protein
MTGNFHFRECAMRMRAHPRSSPLCFPVQVQRARIHAYTCRITASLSPPMKVHHHALRRGSSSLKQGSGLSKFHVCKLAIHTCVRGGYRSEKGKTSVNSGHGMHASCDTGGKQCGWVCVRVMVRGGCVDTNKINTTINTRVRSDKRYPGHAWLDTGGPGGGRNDMYTHTNTNTGPAQHTGGCVPVRKWGWTGFGLD